MRMSFYLPLITQHYKSIKITETITSLWSGCGEIVRCSLDEKACVIKAVNVPDHINHPRISQTEFAINRKRESYLVEFNWYQRYAPKLPVEAKTVSCYNALALEQTKVLILSDFAADGFTNVQLNYQHISCILKWLANFHAFHLNSPPNALWLRGNYWHLDTRPDEYKVMLDSKIKENAQVIDKALAECPHQTLIHGDAKVANFAINTQAFEVLGYDFQYIGAGVGTVDVMYFLGSCLTEQQLYQKAEHYLNEYFEYFTKAMDKFNKKHQTDAVIHAWRDLWPIAWADFYRFLLGWSPQHKKINHFMLEQSDIALNKLFRASY